MQLSSNFIGGKFIGLNETDLELYSHAIQRNESPTNTMLSKWEQSNISIRHLYICLKKMNHLRAMSILKPFVDPSLHHLCDFNESKAMSLNLSNEMSKEQHQPNNNQSIRIHIHPSNQQLRQSPSSSQPADNNQRLLNVDKSNQKNLNCKNNKNVNQFQHQNSIASTKLAAYDDNLPYDEILKATNNFQAKNIIGSGGFGIVYKGFWKGTQVAIKRLKDCNNFDQALIELQTLTRFRIDNIVPLYGISIGDKKSPCLIYQYMVNGSLDDRLQCKHNSQPLSWSQRLNIGLGIAKALNYLHTLKDNPLIHGDVKSANILLDAQMQAKLGDFGLAKYLQDYQEESSPILSSNRLNSKKNLTHITVTQVHGTVAYLPPEYLRSKILSPAVDVYSYGVVQLELMTGCRAFDGKSMLLDKVTDEKEKEMKKASKHCQLLGEFGNPLLNNSTLDKPLAITTTTTTTATTCDCLSCKLYKLRDSRLPHSLENLFCFHSTLRLALDCCNQQKKKRPDFNTILKTYEAFIEQHKQFNQHYNQQHNLTGMNTPLSHLGQNRSSIASSFKVDTLLKTPLEYKLWNEMKKKNASAPPLPESNLSNEQIAAVVINEQSDLVDDNEILLGANALKSLSSNLKELKLSEQNKSEIVVESCEIPLLTELGNRK